MLLLKGLRILQRSWGWGVVSRRHEVADPPGGKPAGEEGEVASCLRSQPLTWLPACAWPPTGRPHFPHSRTRTWYSAWSLSSWSWSVRATSSSSPTRLSCAACWPTSWIRVQVTFEGRARGHIHGERAGLGAAQGSRATEPPPLHSEWGTFFR